MNTQEINLLYESKKSIRNQLFSGCNAGLGLAQATCEFGKTGKKQLDVESHSQNRELRIFCWYLL